MKHKLSRGIQEKLQKEGILSLILKHKKNKNILDFLSRSVLAWRIPGMGEPGGLPSLGLHRVRHD